MPAKSKAQQRLMAAAAHGANFPKAKKVRQSMTHEQMHDFSTGSMKGKPGHVKHAKHAAKHAMPTHHQAKAMGNRYAKMLT